MISDGSVALSIDAEYADNPVYNPMTAVKVKPRCKDELEKTQ
jgi:hypothetical protein